MNIKEAKKYSEQIMLFNTTVYNILQDKPIHQRNEIKEKLYELIDTIDDFIHEEEDKSA